jgi:hypothetical protein
MPPVKTTSARGRWNEATGRELTLAAVTGRIDTRGGITLITQHAIGRHRRYFIYPGLG